MRSVLPRPGTPSSRTWPPANSPVRTWLMTSRCPTITFSTSPRNASNAVTNAWTRESCWLIEVSSRESSLPFPAIIENRQAAFCQPLDSRAWHSYYSMESASRLPKTPADALRPFPELLEGAARRISDLARACPTGGRAARRSRRNRDQRAVDVAVPVDLPGERVLLGHELTAGPAQPVPQLRVTRQLGGS